MTREEVIHDLQVFLDFYNEQTGAIPLCLEEAMAYINAATSEPCEEAVSRQAVLSKIKEVCFSEEWGQFRVDNGSNGQRDFLINYIKQLPPVTPQPKTGHWIKGNYHIRCSECGEDYTYSLRNYCPNCGRKMQEVEK